MTSAGEKPQGLVQLEKKQLVLFLQFHINFAVNFG